MRRSRMGYSLLVLLTIVILIAAAVPIAASDLFRRPYDPAWDVINDLIAKLRINPYPTGGGAPPKFPYWRDPADAFIYFRDVTLVTADGLSLAAWYVPAFSTTGEAAPATVLLCHGFLVDTKWDMLPLLPWLHEAGYSVMLLDFRGHGSSEKQPTSIGPREVLDIQAALDWLAEQGIAGPIAGLGMSMGAAALVNAAVQDDRIDALVLDSLFSEWNEVDFARGYRLPPRWLVPGVQDPVVLMPEIEIPVLIVHGTADILVRVDHAERLFAAANEPKEIWINDSGHAWSAWTYPELYRTKVLGFLRRNLEATKP